MVERRVVHACHDQRHAVGQAKRVRLVDADRAARDRMGDELAARVGPDREEAEVEVTGAKPVGGRLLDGEVGVAVGNLLADRAGRREGPDVFEPAL